MRPICRYRAYAATAPAVRLFMTMSMLAISMSFMTLRPDVVLGLVGLFAGLC